MPRTRVISQTEALYVTPSPATGLNQTGLQLHRTQSVSHSWNVSRVNITQFGQLSPISREINESPSASIDFSYYVTNVLNEQNLGFVTDGSVSAISGLLSRTEDEKNYFLTEAPEGHDNIGYTGTDRVTFGVGNGFLRSYSTEAAVNGFPTATVRIEGLNLVAYASSNGITPAVNPVDGNRLTGVFTLPTAISGIAGQSTILKHGDITMNLGNAALGVDLNDAKIQRYTLSFDLNREPQLKLGSKFAFSRELSFPINVTLSVEANMGDIATGSVSDILCNDTEYDLSIVLRQPSCTGGGPIAVRYDLKGAKLDSASWNSTIGPNKTVSLQWTSNLGGPEDLAEGLFISGILT